MQKLLLTLLLAGRACGHLRGAAPDGRELRIFLNERVAGPRGQRDGVGPDNKSARARRRARQHLRAQKKTARRLQEPDPEDDEYYHDDDFRYEETVEDAREAREVAALTAECRRLNEILAPLQAPHPRPQPYP